MKNFFGRLSGKGIVAAICICLIAVGGAGIYSYNKVADKLNEQLLSSNAVKTPEMPDSPVNAEQTQVAKTTEAPVTEQTETNTSAKAAEAAIDNSSAEAVSSDEVRAMVRPLNGEFISPFSNSELVKSSTLNVWKTHDGVDIAGNMGEKVKSMTSGTVKSVYEDQMLGACVLVDHGSGLEGFYCNLSKDIPVTEGQTVSAGTILGTVGNTAQGEIKEPSHLHFALKKSGEWIDPITFISGEGS